MLRAHLKLYIVLYCLPFQASSSSKEEWIKGVFNLYKDQFSRPYYKLEQDYVQFKQWAKSIKLPEEPLREIQDIVMKTGEELVKIFELCPEVEVMK